MDFLPSSLDRAPLMEVAYPLKQASLVAFTGSRIYPSSATVACPSQRQSRE